MQPGTLGGVQTYLVYLLGIWGYEYPKSSMIGVLDGRGVLATAVEKSLVLIATLLRVKAPRA